MNTMPADDTTYATEIGIDAEEEELGIVGGRLIRWKIVTVYIYECADGRVAVGIYIGPKSDPDLAAIRARRKALNWRRADITKFPAPISPRAASPSQADGALKP